MDQAQTTVFEFLEAVELAYLGWGNSVQKANQLYNKHLSEDIKSYLINISDNYSLMKTWLINNYSRPSRIVISLVVCLEKINHLVGIGRRSLYYTPPSWVLFRDWRNYPGLITLIKRSWRRACYPAVH